MNESFKVQLFDLIVADAKNYGMNESDLTEISSAGRFKNAILTNADYQVAHAQIMNRESNVMTAKNLSSLFKHAAAANVDISTAVPAVTELFFTILVDDVISHGIRKNGNEYYLTIKRNNSIIIGDYSYVFKNDILIKYIDDFTEDRKGIINVEYVPLDGQHLAELPFIVSQRAYISGLMQIGFKAKVYQQTESVHEFAFTNAQFDMFNVNVNDDIVSFSVEYQDTPNSTPVQMNTELYFNRTSANTIYYKFTNSKSITIMHKTITGGFKPIVGGTLRVTVVTSKGDEANFEYDYQPYMKMSNAESFMMDIRSVSSLSEGGSSSATNVEGLRNQIVKANSARNAIAIEKDLDSVLLSIGDNNVIFKSVKYRNDIYRLFNVFTNINFQQGDRTYTIPTDTGSIKAPLTLLNKVERDKSVFYTLIPETHRIGFKHDIDETALQYHLTDKNDADLYFRSPYIISIDMQKQYIRTYVPYVDARVLAEPTWTTDEIGVYKKFVFNNFTMKRDMTSDKMEFRFRLRTDNTDPEILHSYTYDRELVDNGIGKVIFRFNTGDSSSEAYMVAKMLEYDEESDTYLYGFELQSDFIPFDRTIRVSGMFDTLQNAIDNVSGNKTKDIKLDSSIEISGFRKDNPDNVFKMTNTWVSNVEILEDCTKITPLQYSVLFGEDALSIPLTPLVDEYFFDIQAGKKHIYNSISSIKATILSVIPMLETNYDISIKFANTTGYSKFITVGTAKIPLKSLALRPKFYIRLKDASYNINRLRWLMSKYINEHEYLLNDFHATSMIDSILDVEKASIDILQFVGFDGYTDREQLLSHSKMDMKNSDIIEATSVKLVYEETLEEFNYDIEFQYI